MKPIDKHEGKLGKVYFTKATETAIVEYNQLEDPEEREYVFRSKIHAPLDKLAENIINRYKFPYIDGSFDEVKAQVVSFLVMNLHKYTKEKGMAFSYFSVIAKNYLILHNNNGYRDEKRTLSLSDDSEDHFTTLDERFVIDTSRKDVQGDMRDFIDLMVVFWDDYLEQIFKKQRDRHIANAVVHLMRRVDYIENFNKKAIYLMIREMTDERTPHVTKVINKMKVINNSKLSEFRKTGHVSPYVSKLKS